MQTKTDTDAAKRVKEFDETIHNADEFDRLSALDYNPYDRETFILIEWEESPEGREQMTRLQQKVTGVDTRFDGISLKDVNLVRGYAKFYADL